MKVYIITHHGDIQWDAPAFLNEQKAKDWVKEKGWKSPWVGVDELELID